MKKLLVIVSLLFLGFFAKSQELLVPLNDDYEMEVQTAAYSSDYLFHTAMRGWSYSQFDGIINLDSINELYRIKINKKGKFANYILNSILNDDFIRLKDDNYYVAINPYIDFELGSDGHRTTWVNTRGAEIKGTIGKQFAFYTNIKENQAVFPEYIDDYCTTIGVVPGQGFANRFKTNGRDFTNASAYLAYRPVKWFDATLGYGKNFIGDGYRSMMLSDNAANYPYLKPADRPSHYYGRQHLRSQMGCDALPGFRYHETLEYRLFRCRDGSRSDSPAGDGQRLDIYHHRHEARL